MSTKKTTNTPAAKRGRPTVAGSKRQAVLAMRQAKRDQGLEIKRGRPKNPVTIQVDVKAKTRKVVKPIDTLVDSIVNEA